MSNDNLHPKSYIVYVRKQYGDQYRETLEKKKKEKTLEKLPCDLIKEFSLFGYKIAPFGMN